MEPNKNKLQSATAADYAISLVEQLFPLPILTVVKKGKESVATIRVTDICNKPFC